MFIVSLIKLLSASLNTRAFLLTPASQSSCPRMLNTKWTMVSMFWKIMSAS